MAHLPNNEHGLIFTCITTEDFERLSLTDVPPRVSLKDVSAKVTIRGFVCHIHVNLKYYNDMNFPIQVSYVCPVDTTAAIYKFEAELEGRKIIANCLPKEKAEKIYKDAINEGKTAVLGREHDQTDDLFQLDLGNLPQGEYADLTLGMVMQLPVNTDGSLHFVLPTVFNPRYAPSGTESGNMAVPVSSPSVMYNFEVTAEVMGSYSINKIISHTESITVTYTNDKHTAMVTQKGGNTRDHDWNINIYYNNPYSAQVLKETGDRSSSGFMKDDTLMINFFPELPQSSYSNCNEIIFVIDRSGSMQGENIENAKNTLLLFLKSLPEGCKFNILSFGSSFSFLFNNGSQIYNNTTVEKALKLQKMMTADMGGTEILLPLKAIFNLPLDMEFARQVIVITDGEVWNVEAVLELVANNAHNTRVFSVGIGHGASSALVKGLAQAGGGRSELVIEQNSLQTKVMGLITSMLQESVRNVKIECKLEPFTRITLLPKVPPVIFAGQHLTLFARIPAETKMLYVKVYGKLTNGDMPCNVINEHDVKIIHDENLSLHRLAAKAQLKKLALDQEEGWMEEMKTISSLSTVVCRFTALVGVDQEGKTIAKKKEDIPIKNLINRGGHAQKISALSGCMVPMSFPTYASLPLRVPCSNPSISNYLFCKTSKKFKKTVNPSVYDELSIECERFEFDDEYGAANCDFTSFYNKEQGIKTTSQSGECFLSFITMQNIDGSWNLDDVINFLKNTSTITTDSTLKGNVDDQSWATALAIAILQNTFSSRQPQWMLLTEKAKLYLKKKSHNPSELIARATAVLRSD